jgi:hypothetical protein
MTLARVIQRKELQRATHQVALRDVLLPVSEVPFEKIKVRPLTPNQRGVIALHLAGMSYVDISKLTGHSPPVIAYIMNHPSAQPLLQKGYAQIDKEMSSLYSPSVEAIRRGLNSDDERTALQASTIALKALGKIDADTAKNTTTAEDVVSRIIEERRTIEIQSEGPVCIKMSQGKRSVEREV